MKLLPEAKVEVCLGRCTAGYLSGLLAVCVLTLSTTGLLQELQLRFAALPSPCFHFLFSLAPKNPSSSCVLSLTRQTESLGTTMGAWFSKRKNEDPVKPLVPHRAHPFFLPTPGVWHVLLRWIGRSSSRYKKLRARPKKAAKIKHKTQPPKGCLEKKVKIHV